MADGFAGVFVGDGVNRPGARNVYRLTVMSPQSPELFILSVHFHNPFWLLTQREFLDTYADVRAKRLFCVEGIPENLKRSDECWFPFQGRHAASLDFLVEQVPENSSSNQWLLFLDSDALPITHLSAVLGGSTSPVAVQRRENLGDLQPHPSFCLIRREEFNILKASWAAGPGWEDAYGRFRTDVGGELLHALENHEMAWEPLHRLKTLSFHPLLFGIYGSTRLGGVVYHHGAGSRPTKVLIDKTLRRKAPILFALRRLRFRLNLFFAGRLKSLGLRRRLAFSMNFTEEVGRAISKALSSDTQTPKYLLGKKNVRVSREVRRSGLLGARGRRQERLWVPPGVLDASGAKN